MTARPLVQGFFDEATNSVSYVVSDPATKTCAIIDLVLDYDAAAGRTDTNRPTRSSPIRQNGFKLDWILETHVHADHLSAAPYIQEQLGGRLGIGEKITVVQDTFGKIFNAGTEFQRDGSQFDQLFKDGDTFTHRHIEAAVMHTPGHTPACMTYVIGDAAFIGDTLFMPDCGTARADFPGGDARRSTARSARCCRFRRRRGSSCATTTGAGTREISRGRRRSPPSARTISMSATASARTSSSPCAPRATRRWVPEAHHPLDPGQHECRPLPGPRQGRQCLSESAGEPDLGTLIRLSPNGFAPTRKPASPPPIVLPCSPSSPSPISPRPMPRASRR